MKKTRIPYNKSFKKNRIILIELGVEIRSGWSVYKTSFKIKKQLWFDEYSDTDLFTPSCPHLHSLDRKYKLNVYSGELYDVRLKKTVRDKRVSQKELNNLWNDPRFREFATEMRRLYFEKFPDSKLPEVPFE